MQQEIVEQMNEIIKKIGLYPGTSAHRVRGNETVVVIEDPSALHVYLTPDVVRDMLRDFVHDAQDPEVSLHRQLNEWLAPYEISEEASQELAYTDAQGYAWDVR